MDDSKKNRIPEHWVEVPLGNIVLYRKGKKPDILYSEKNEDYLPYILIDELEGNLPRNYAQKLNLPIASKNDVLLVWDGSIGKCSSGIEGIIGSTLVALTPLGGMPTKFLEYLIINANRFIKETSTGTGLQHINKNFFNEYIVNLPPLNEQKRIVEKLDALLPKVKNAKARLEKNPAILKKFRQSVLAAACSGKLTEEWREENPNQVVETINEQPENKVFDIPETWQWVTWESIVSKNKHSFKRGPFGSAIKKEFFVKSGYKVYEQCCPINDDCSLGNYYITEEKYRELIAFKVQAGDLLISCSGTLGCITEVPNNYEEGVINQALLKVTLDTNKIINSYFIKYFRSHYFQKLIFENAQGSAQLNIKGIKELKKLPIPLPPLEEQHEIVRRVEKLFALADSVEAKYQKAMERVEKLEQAILAKAFRGELVEPDPNDEPATELLKRILEEKAKLEAGKKSKNPRERKK